MLKSVVLVLFAAAAASLMLPGVARADDAALAGTVTVWSVNVTGPAEALQRINANTTTTQALKASNRLAAVATAATRAIASQKPSSAKGRRLKALAGGAFADFARAGRLLASAIRDFQAGRTGPTATAKVNRASRLAKDGAALLTRAGKILTTLP